MQLLEDPITRELRLLAPDRAARVQLLEQSGGSGSGCPFCPGNEHTTPQETGRIVGADGAWLARSFPNRFPLTQPHEVLVPSPRHVTAWRDLTMPELCAGLELLLGRRAALAGPGRYVHAFVNDGRAAGASISHAHAQLVTVPSGAHSERLIRGVLPGDCALCALLAAADGRRGLVVERGRRHAILAHPAPRMGGALLVVPTEHDDDLDAQHVPELGALLHRALAALPVGCDVNLWVVGDPPSRAHWYVELQPRTTNLAGVELGLGLGVSVIEPGDCAARARERLGIGA